MSRRFPRLLGYIFVTIGFVLLVSLGAAADKYEVVYGFGPMSSTPSSGLTIDGQGNAYGVTLAGGHDNSGSVYGLSRTTGYHLLYPFSHSGTGGRYPLGNLALDAAGNLYGTTYFGGITRQDCSVRTCGVVFKLSPPSNGVGPWTETVLYSFCQRAYCPDGSNPASGVMFDSAGNLYGTTNGGGSFGAGTVFELSPSAQAWTETVLYSFGSGFGDGETPSGGVIFDAAGNLYGETVRGGGSGFGTVFELSPSAGGWQEKILYAFDGEETGGAPAGSVAFDTAGNLYGTTINGGSLSCPEGGCGTVFQLSPALDGTWTQTVIHTFAGGDHDGEFPMAGVTVDSSGNVYGTTDAGGLQGCPYYGCGTVFKLAPRQDGQWTEILFFFSGGAEGANPTSPLTFDSLGNAYGTATVGGSGLNGVAFEITQ